MERAQSSVIALTTIVLGLMETECVCELEHTKGGGKVPLAVDRRGRGCKISRRFRLQTTKFQGTLTTNNAVCMHCIVEAHNQNQNAGKKTKTKTVATDVTSIMTDPAVVNLDCDKNTPLTKHNHTKAKCRHMVGKISMRFTVKSHKLIGNKSVEAVHVDHGSRDANWEWPIQMFPKSFFEEVLPQCANSGFLAQGGVI